MDPALSPGSAGYSPSLTNYAETPQVAREVASHAESPFYASSDVPIPQVPRPPDPAVGGKSGRSRAFGWTTGLLHPRSFRTLFTGRTLVVPNQGPHPVYGPVGFSNRTGRLAAGVEALYSDPVPTPQEVADMLTKPNPVLYEMNRGDISD